MRYTLPTDNMNLLKEDSNVASSDSNVASSDSNVASSDSNVASSAPKYGNLNDTKVATSIKKKMSREELQELILENCKEWISLDDLATIVVRKPKYLRNQIMPLLVAAKIIQMLHPEKPNHPKQAYKIVD